MAMETEPDTPLKDYYRLSVKSELESIPVILTFVWNVLASFDFDRHTVFDIGVAVEEACTNIISYGYGEGEKGSIDLLIEKAKEDFVVSIVSYGKRFDPHSADSPDLTSSLADRKIGGLGIYFMKQLMDKVIYEYENGVGTLTMFKYSRHGL